MGIAGKAMNIAICVILLVMLFVPSVWAAPVLSGYQVMESKSSNYNLKAWRVSFSSPVQENDINNYLRITDDNNQKIPSRITLSDDRTEVTLTPLTPYTWGKEYRVYVDGNLQAASGAFLKQGVVMPFVAEQPLYYITDITNRSSSLLTSFSITCSTGVYSVKVNESNAHYKGGNRYECNVAGLAAGDIVNLKAYDSQGSLLETRQYEVSVGP